jgi:cell division protein FtsB
LLFISGYFMRQQNTKLKVNLSEANKLNVALSDTIKQRYNEYNELVSEKKTLQTTIKKLESENITLNAEQKELLSRIKTLNKDKKVIAAALVETRIRLDSILNIDIIGVVEEKDSALMFSGKSKYINYGITVNNVKPLMNLTPTLQFDSLSLYNKQFIEFHWDKDKKNDYPISFSISNSNPYFTTSNIESYAIPELQKQEIDPSFWGKTKKWFKNNYDKPIYFTLGVGTAYILFK